MEAVSTDLLKQIAEDMRFLKNEMVEIRGEISELKDIELEVKPEYLKKLNKIEKGKFLSREELDKEVES